MRSGIHIGQKSGYLTSSNTVPSGPRTPTYAKHVGRQANRPDMGAPCGLRGKDKFEETQFMRPRNELQETLNRDN